MHNSWLLPHLSSENIVTMLGNRSVGDLARKLTDVVDRQLSDLVIVPSCFVAWATSERDGHLTLNALGNSERIFVEFYVGAANTLFSNDPVHKYRALIDTPHSKAQVRREGRVPKYSYKYGIEHYGVLEAVECPIGMYVDSDSLLISCHSHCWNSTDMYILRQPWVPQFIDCNTLVNMIVIPMGLARKKVVNYFSICMNAVRQPREKGLLILDSIKEAVDAF